MVLISSYISFASSTHSFSKIQISCARGITYYPPKPLAAYLPTFALALFVAIPFLYAGLNFISAPSAASLDTLWDGHSRECECKDRAEVGVNEGERIKEWVTRSWSQQNKSLFANVSASSVPEICDIDVSIINRFQSEMLRQTEGLQHDSR